MTRLRDQRRNGGSGVVPDLVIGPDTAERTYNRAAGDNPLPFWAVLTSVASDLKRKGVISSEYFTITPAMRQAVYQLLQQEDVPIPPDLFETLGPTIDRRLSQMIAHYVFGWSAELRYDEQVQAAVGLLRKARTPKDLLPLVASDRGYVAAPN